MDAQQTPTLPFLLSHTAQKHPDVPALITEKMALTYHELNLLVEKTVSRLKAKDLQHGDRVGILMPNSWQYAVLVMAMLRAGIVAAPLSTRRPEKQIGTALEKVGCQKLVIADEIDIPGDLDSNTLFRVCELVKTDLFIEPKKSPLEGGQGGVTDFDLHTHTTIQRSSASNREVLIKDLIFPPIEKPHGYLSKNQWDSSIGGEGKPCFVHNAFRPQGSQYINPDQDATIIFTSGSAGKPKAVLHSYKNHYYSALGSNLNIPFGPGDRWLLSLPLYHVGGLGILFRAALGGGTVVIPDAGFDLVDAMTQHEISHISLVATQLYRMLQKEMSDKKFNSLKAVLLGGSAIPASLLKQANKHKLPLFTTYGCTEMASQVATTGPDDLPNKLHTSGRPLAHREVMISPEGEILVRGETLFKGYLVEKGLRKPFSRDGWFASGDLGEFDADGYLVVKGRKDNMFISGGENIQPEEIEQALCKIDGVLQAVVVPVADAEFGQCPVAFVKMKNSTQPDVNFFSKQLAQHIARFKIPARYLPWPQGLQENGMKMDRKYFIELVASQ